MLSPWFAESKSVWRKGDGCRVDKEKGVCEKARESWLQSTTGENFQGADHWVQVGIEDESLGFSAMAMDTRVNILSSSCRQPATPQTVAQPETRRELDASAENPTASDTTRMAKRPRMAAGDVMSSPESTARLGAHWPASRGIPTRTSAHGAIEVPLPRDLACVLGASPRCRALQGSNA
jgi:hypothetical protein